MAHTGSANCDHCDQLCHRRSSILLMLVFQAFLGQKFNLYRAAIVVHIEPHRFIVPMVPWYGMVRYGMECMDRGPPVSIVSMIAAIIVPNDGSQPHRSIVPGPFPFLTLPL